MTTVKWPEEPKHVQGVAPAVALPEELVDVWWTPADRLPGDAPPREHGKCRLAGRSRCAQGDSNSHPRYRGQGPQPCAPTCPQSAHPAKRAMDVIAAFGEPALRPARSAAERMAVKSSEGRPRQLSWRPYGS